MAYVISDSCVSCGTCEPEKSMQQLVLNVEHALVFAQQEQFLRVNYRFKRASKRMVVASKLFFSYNWSP